MAPALKRLSTKDLFLAQKLEPSLEEFTINIVGIFLILIINLYTLMNQSAVNLNLLELEIEQLEKKLALLLQEEIREKNQNRDLQLELKELQQYSEEECRLKSKLRQQHRCNMDYFDKKIENHQSTLQQYKSLYQSLQGKDYCSTSKFNMLNGSTLNQDPLNYSYIKSSKHNNHDLKLSIGSFSSTVRRKNQENEGRKQINVVCEMTCEKCKGVFKPYRYYSHINHCQVKPFDNSQLSSSMLVD